MATRHYRASSAGLNDPELANQCEMYLLTSAIPSIMADQPFPEDHDARLAWAKVIESDPFKRKIAVQRLVLKAIANPQVRQSLADDGRAQDSDIEYVGSLALAELIALGT